jgi:hypothetical protein
MSALSIALVRCGISSLRSIDDELFQPILKSGKALQSPALIVWQSHDGKAPALRLPTNPKLNKIAAVIAARYDALVPQQINSGGGRCETRYAPLRSSFRFVRHQ